MTTSDSGSDWAGSLRRLKESLPEVKGSIPTPSPMPSSSTGRKAKAATSGAVPTAGTGRGAAGVVATASELQARRRRTARQIGLPEEAASLVPLLGSALVIEAKPRDGTHGHEGWEITAWPKAECADEVAAARRALAPWLEPVDADHAMAMLAEMSLLTKRAATDDDTSEATVRLYAQRLGQYPLDVVGHVLNDWTATKVFWPAWAELQERLDARMRNRRALWAALQ